MKRNLSLILAIGLFFSIGLTSCDKNGEDDTANVDFKLTDAPGQYDKVLIDLQKIEIHTDVDGWQSPASFNPGIYDLLELNNGMDTLLASVQLPTGNLSQVRLVLGNNNSVVFDSVSYPLSTPSAQQSGLKINLHENLLANESYTFWLDFDAGKSIIEKGNGDYSLKPVIRAYSGLTNGKIKGYVMPLNAQATLYSIQGVDTFTAIPNSDGFFMFTGMNGSYDINVSPANAAYQDTNLYGVQATYGQITDLDTITLN